MRYFYCGILTALIFPLTLRISINSATLAMLFMLHPGSMVYVMACAGICAGCGLVIAEYAAVGARPIYWNLITRFFSAMLAGTILVLVGSAYFWLVEGQVLRFTSWLLLAFFPETFAAYGTHWVLYLLLGTTQRSNQRT